LTRSPAARESRDPERFSLNRENGSNMTHETTAPGPVCYTPIGTIHSPWTDIAGMPIQPGGARGVKGTVEIFFDYAEGLRDIEGFSRVILIYSFHRITRYELVTKPFLDTVPRGVFATRSPGRPNAIGLSCVRLAGREGSTLHIEDVDVLDGTPLLDIKPYVPSFDSFPEAACGWLEKVAGQAESARSDERFR
jgi:tRNA (adenine37-N6)-methyltransferase